MFTGVVVSIMSTISTAGILAGVGYLRSIARRLKAIEDRTFNSELHVLNLYQLVDGRRSA